MRSFAFLLIWAIAVGMGAASAGEAPANFIVHETPEAAAQIDFDDADGRVLTLADFKGKVVLLNIWATWCVSCREEMPTLDRSQAALGGPEFEVVALSIDRAGPEAVRGFYAETGVKQLALYIDDTGAASRALGLVGLPTTLLIDRSGREIGRLIGPAEWDSPEMVAFIRGRIAEE